MNETKIIATIEGLALSASTGKSYTDSLISALAKLTAKAIEGIEPKAISVTIPITGWKSDSSEY